MNSTSLSFGASEPSRSSSTSSSPTDSASSEGGDGDLGRNIFLFKGAALRGEALRKHEFNIETELQDERVIVRRSCSRSTMFYGTLGRHPDEGRVGIASRKRMALYTNSQLGLETTIAPTTNLNPIGNLVYQSSSVNINRSAKALWKLSHAQDERTLRYTQSP